MVERQLPSTVYNHFQDVKLFKEQEIGHGSYATVYRAQCDDLPCAAKVLHSDFFDQQDPDPGEPKFILRFVEECKILPSITHPNIVQCFGTYQDPDTDLPVLLMELMDENLTNYLERFTDPLPYHIEISFSYDIALGLSYLHSRGYVHRDLSSNNVLIMAGIRAKITDFGMCRAMTGVSRQTRLTLCPGTPAFMPPEALLEPPVYTDKLDIFTLGVVMIQIMSRQYPKPGPAHRQLPSSMLHQVIPEEERRSNHIKLIRCDHPMLPLAKQCIQNLEEKRPSSRNVCSDLRSLKESSEYQRSKDEASVEHKLERESHLHQLHLTKVMMEMEDKIANIKAENSQQIESIHCYYGQHERDLQLQLTKTTAVMQEKIETMKAEYSQQIESIQLQHERELQLQLTKTTMDMQDMQETMKAEHSQQIESIQLQHEREIHLQLTKTTADMQDKLETMKAEHSQQIENIQLQHERELQLQLTKTTTDMQDKLETMKAEHSQQIENIQLQHERELQLQLTKTTTDMQNKLETIKVEHSQQIQNIHRYYCQHKEELQHQVVKISTDMQDKIETMKTEHSRQIHFHYHKLEMESQLQLNKITTEMKDKIAEMKTLHCHEIEDIHRHYHQQNSHDHFEHPNLHLSVMTTTSNDHDGGINHDHSFISDNSDPAPIHTEAQGSLESASPSTSEISDPGLSTPPEKGIRCLSSKYGERKLVFNLADVESSLDSSWVKMDIIVNTKESKDGLSTLDTQPRPRERAAAFSLLINPHSDDFGDYSGPNLDDHLAYRSHDSGHMGLSESPAGSAIGKTAEEKNESEQQLLDKEPEQEDTCISGSQLVRVPGNVPHIKKQQLLEEESKGEDTRILENISLFTEEYDDVVLIKDDETSSSEISEDTSIDSQPPSIYYQSTQKAVPPIPQPRYYSGKEEKKLSRYSSLPTITLSDACPSIPRPRSDNNLLSMKGSQGLGTSPSSPSRNKPAIKPRTPRSRKNEEICMYASDIQNAIPCWYCTNLTTLKICDVCGNEQHRETIV